MPPRFDEVRALVGVRLLALLYAVRQAASALQAKVPPADVIPVQCPGGKPVIEVPGQVPQLPVMRVSPVLVRVVAAIAPKLLAAPNKTGSARFSMAGWASPMACWAVMRAKRANWQLLNIVHFMVMDFWWVKVEIDVI
jgi:hypothetical protein